MTREVTRGVIRGPQGGLALGGYIYRQGQGESPLEESLIRSLATGRDAS